MASKGAYVDGTDGSDHVHRQQVHRNYGQIIEHKKQLYKLEKIQLVYWAVAGALCTYAETQFGFATFSPYTLLFLALLPLLLRKDKANNNQLAMAGYSVLSGFIAAYALWIGIGRSLDFLTYSSNFTSFCLVNIAVHIGGVLAHLVAVYHTRKLIDCYKSVADQARTKRRND